MVKRTSNKSTTAGSNPSNTDKGRQRFCDAIERQCWHQGQQLHYRSKAQAHQQTSTPAPASRATSIGIRTAAINNNNNNDIPPLEDQAMLEMVFESPPTMHFSIRFGSYDARYLSPFRANSAKSPSCRVSRRPRHPAPNNVRDTRCLHRVGGMQREHSHRRRLSHPTKTESVKLAWRLKAGPALLVRKGNAGSVSS